MNMVAPTSPQAEPLAGGGFGPDEGLAELTPGAQCIPGREGLRRAEAGTSPSAPDAGVGGDSSPTQPPPVPAGVAEGRPCPGSPHLHLPTPPPGIPGGRGAPGLGLGEATHALPT